MRILGLEFGAWSLKAVEIESRFRRLEVLDFHEVRLPLAMSDPVATYKIAVAKLLDKLPSLPEKVVTSLPTSQVSVRFFELPIKQFKKVEQTYRFELEDNIPFKLENTLIEHQLSKTAGGTAVTAAIAPRSHIESHLKWLESVGVDPDWLSFDGMGLVNLYFAGLANKKGKKKEEPDENCRLLLDLGHVKTGFSVVQGDRLLYHRTLSWGGGHLTHALSTALDLSLEDAEKEKHEKLNLAEIPTELTDRDRKLLQSGFNSFAPLLADLHHSMVAFRAAQKKTIASVMIAGGTSSLPGLDKLLEEKLRKPVSHFKPLQNPPKGLDVPKETLVRFGEAYGQSMVFERKSSLLFNFRKQDFTKKTSLTEVGTFIKNKDVTQLLRYAGVLAAVLFIHVSIASHLAQKELASSQEEISKVFSTAFRTIPKKMRNNLTKNPEQLQKFLRQRNKQLNQKLKMLSSKHTPMLSIVKQVSVAFPPEVKVDVNTLSIDDRSFSINGVLYEGDLNLATQKIKKIKDFKNVRLSREGQRFTYSGQLRGVN